MKPWPKQDKARNKKATIEDFRKEQRKGIAITKLWKTNFKWIQKFDYKMIASETGSKQRKTKKHKASVVQDLQEYGPWEDC